MYTTEYTTLTMNTKLPHISDADIVCCRYDPFHSSLKYFAKQPGSCVFDMYLSIINMVHTDMEIIYSRVFQGC